MGALHLKPPSRKQFMRMITDSSAEDLSADNCCCPTCKHCGYQNFEELRSVARDRPHRHARVLPRRRAARFPRALRRGRALLRR